MRVLLGVALAVALAVAGPTAQSRPLVAPVASPIYQRLLPQIERIKIFDHHAHPGFGGDEEVDPARFKWVFYIDPVLFPFDNAALAARNPDQAAFMPNQTKLIRRFVQQAGLKELPPTLADDLAFVTRVLEDHQRRGAIAAKFEVAYFRSFVFDDPPRDAVSAARSSSTGSASTMREPPPPQPWQK